MFHLITSAIFIWLTILGNGLILFFAYLFFVIEAGVNPDLLNYLDALWWAFATVTTVGYGDITPVTPYGKILGIVLMLFGTALFATYTAFFAQGFLKGNLLDLKKMQKREGINFELLRQLKKELQRIETMLEDQSRPK